MVVRRPLSSALMGVFLLLSPQAPPAVGFVLSASGPWQLNGRPLKQGEAVPGGARLLLARDATFGSADVYSIAVVLLDNTDVSVRCTRARPCPAGLRLPPTVTAQATLALKLENVFRLIFERPERYVGLMSRDASAEASRFADGVATLEGGRMRLLPFFQGLAQGRYRLQFDRVVSGAAMPTSPASADIVWDGTAGSATPDTSVAPGLYRIALSRPTDQTFAVREAWILAARPENLDAAKAAFDDAVAAARGWARDVPQRDVAIFLHASLSRIASQWP